MPRTTAAREAGPGDLELVGRLLARCGVTVAPASLAERLGSEGSGIVLGDDACASWALDGGALHVYDVAGSRRALPDALAALNAIGRRSFAAVLTAAVYADDPLLAELLAQGFEIDWEEPDLRGGETVRLLGLVREIA
jgi:hypothetical protein